MSTKLQIILLGFILAAGLGLRIYSGLTTLPLRDAQTYLLCAEDYRIHGDFDRAFSPVAKPPHPAAPGYLLLLAVGCDLGIPVTYWGMGLNLAFGLLTIVGVWLIAKTAFDSPALALGAAALAATLPSLIEQSAQIMRDPAYIMLAIFAIYFAMRHCDRPKSCNWLWFALCAAAATFTRREGAELLVVWLIAQLVAIADGKTGFRSCIRRLAVPATAGIVVFLTALVVASFAVSECSALPTEPLPKVWFGRTDGGAK